MKTKATSVASILIAGIICVAFVTAITWNSFDNPTISLIAAGVTFGVVVGSLLLLRLIQKEDDQVKPGSPRLK